MGITRRRWALLLGVVVLVGLVGCAEQVGPASASGPASSSASSGSDVAAAITAWGRGGGGESAMKVARASAVVETAGGNAVLLRSYCTNLDETAAQAQKYPPIPDPEADRHWTRALGYARETARACVNAVTTGDPAWVQATIDAANACGAESDKATARVKAIQAGG